MPCFGFFRTGKIVGLCNTRNYFRSANSCSSCRIAFSHSAWARSKSAQAWADCAIMSVVDSVGLLILDSGLLSILDIFHTNAEVILVFLPDLVRCQANAKPQILKKSNCRKVC